MPTTGIVEKEPIQRRPRPVCEHRDQSTGGKLLRNIRKRNLDDAHPIDRGRDGDRELISRQLSINLNLKRSTFLAEAPWRQRAAWEAQTDASVFCELLRSRMRKAIMSRAMLSPGRIPASKRPATISTMPRSTETSTLYRNVDADFGIQRQKAGDHRSQDEVCGWRRNRQRARASGLAFFGALALSRIPFVVMPSKISERDCSR